MQDCIIRVSRPVDDSHFLRKYIIFVDELKTSSIAVGQCVDIYLSPGTHIIRVQIDFWGSQELKFDAIPNKIIEFNAFSTSKFGSLFYAIASPKEYLSIEKIGNIDI